MRRVVFVIIEFFCVILIVVSLSGCIGKINYLLGERIVELNVKNSQGSITPIYLKSNGDVLTISESSNMKYIASQENSAISYELIFLYKSTTDTLYLVWWGNEQKDSPQIKTDANIKFIYEPYFHPEVVQKYLSLGFTKFPEDSYY